MWTEGRKAGAGTVPKSPKKGVMLMPNVLVGRRPVVAIKFVDPIARLPPSLSQHMARGGSSSFWEDSPLLYTLSVIQMQTAADVWTLLVLARIFPERCNLLGR